MKLKLILLAALLSLSASMPPKLLWVAIGDSITYLNDHQNETGNRVTKGYMTRVVERLPQLEYVNKGYNGWTSGGIAQKLRPWV